MMADVSPADLDRTWCSDMAADHTQSFKTFMLDSCLLEVVQ